MTATYVAWNGQSYPWPPPEGWYEASDGRWWAAGSGPNPPAPGSGSETAVHGGEPPPSTDQETILSNQPTAVVGPPPSLDDRGALPSVSTPEAPTAGGPHLPPSQPGGGSRTPVFIGVGVVAALAVLGLAVLAFRGPDETPDDNATTTTLETPATATSPPTTAAPTTTASTELQSTTISDLEKVGLFRGLLVKNELSSDELSDDDIVEFGTAFCVFARIAQDEVDFDEFRQEALGESESELTDVELSVAIDAALVSFCPTEAERLGIGV